MSNYPSKAYECDKCGEVVSYQHTQSCQYPLVECAGCQELVHINSLVGDLCCDCYEDAKEEMEGKDEDNEGLLDSKE